MAFRPLDDGMNIGVFPVPRPGAAKASGFRPLEAEEEIDPNLGVGPKEIVSPGAGDAALRAVGRGAWALPSLVGLPYERALALEQKVRGSDKSVSELTDAQRAESRRAEAEYPWLTGIVRGLAEAPSTMALPQQKVIPGGNALTQAGQQFALGTSTSAADSPVEALAEGGVRAPIAGVLGALAPPMPKAPGPTWLETRAGKQAVRAHGGTARDLELLQAEFGEGAVGDEAAAGLKVLETKGADGKPVLPWFTSKEGLANRWKGVQEQSNRVLNQTKYQTDTAAPGGAVDTASTVARMRTDALPVADNSITRQAFGAAPGKAIEERIAAIEAENASPIIGAPLKNQTLAESEALKTALQQRARSTGSSRYPSKDPAAIRADPELQGLGALGRVQKEAGEEAVQNTLGPDAAADFVRAKERWGFSEKMERLAHNSYNAESAGRETFPGSKPGVIRTLLTPPLEASHAPRARLYHGLAQAGKFLPDAAEVGGAAPATPALSSFARWLASPSETPEEEARKVALRRMVNGEGER
jgi:hypothetical protein